MPQWFSGPPKKHSHKSSHSLIVVSFNLLDVYVWIVMYAFNRHIYCWIKVMGGPCFRLSSSLGSRWPDEAKAERSHVKCRMIKLDFKTSQWGKSQPPISWRLAHRSHGDRKVPFLWTTPGKSCSNAETVSWSWFLLSSAFRTHKTHFLCWVYHSTFLFLEGDWPSLWSLITQVKPYN